MLLLTKGTGQVALGLFWMSFDATCAPIPGKGYPGVMWTRRQGMGKMDWSRRADKEKQWTA